jgi:hypothetical protein
MVTVEAHRVASMKAFEVYVNGQHLLTAGIGDDGVLASGITWVGGAAPRPATGRIDFRVGGVDGPTGEHIDWSVPTLGVGDEVKIRIIESDQVTPEHRRFKPDGM